MRTITKAITRVGVKGLVVATAGAVTAGLLTLSSTGSSTSADGNLAFKRDDDAVDVVMTVDDDDDDDTRSRASRDNGTSRDGTGVSRSRRDATNSRHTKVSRDRDKSRRDLTRDMTKDGKGKLKRDWSKNHTNDRSRNDTRGGRR